MINVYETQVSHVYDVIFYRDGSTRHLGDDKSAMVADSIDVKLLNGHQQLQVTQKPGLLVFTQKQSSQILPGTITEAQKSPPATNNLLVKMLLIPSQGQYNPRFASMTLGNINTQNTIWLYPAVQFSHGHHRALYGHIEFANKTPASWALLELRVEYKPAKFITLYAQADQNGEFDMPLTGLPSRPKNISHYLAHLTIKSQAEELADSQTAADPDSFSNRKVGLSIVNDVVTYGDTLSLNLKPELRTRVITTGTERLIINHLNN